MKKTAEAVTKTSQVETTPIAEKTASVKTVETKTEVKEAAEKVAAEKASAKKTAAKAAVEKTAKAVKKTPGRRSAAAKESSAKGRAKKAEVKTSITLQFYGKSYTEEELLKIAKDVWKFDLKKKAGELESVELYVKPEENTCYYVMNKDIGGSFSL